MTCIMTIFCFMSVITIISDFSCQIPASGKHFKLVYVLSVWLVKLCVSTVIFLWITLQVNSI